MENRVLTIKPFKKRCICFMRAKKSRGVTSYIKWRKLTQAGNGSPHLKLLDKYLTSLNYKHYISIAQLICVKSEKYLVIPIFKSFVKFFLMLFF